MAGCEILAEGRRAHRARTNEWSGAGFEVEHDTHIRRHDEVSLVGWAAADLAPGGTVAGEVIPLKPCRVVVDLDPIREVGIVIPAEFRGEHCRQRGQRELR